MRHEPGLDLARQVQGQIDLEQVVGPGQAVLRRGDDQIEPVERCPGPADANDTGASARTQRKPPRIDHTAPPGDQGKIRPRRPRAVRRPGGQSSSRADAVDEYAPDRVDAIDALYFGIDQPHHALQLLHVAGTGRRKQPGARPDGPLLERIGGSHLQP